MSKQTKLRLIKTWSKRSHMTLLTLQAKLPRRLLSCTRIIKSNQRLTWLRVHKIRKIVTLSPLDPIGVDSFPPTRRSEQRVDIG